MNGEVLHTLSIRLNTDCFKYTVSGGTSEADGETVVWKTDVSLSLTANLRRFFQENEELCSYQRVNITLETTRYVTVPVELYDEGQAKLLFYHSLAQRDNETVLSDFIHPAGVVLIYGIDTNAYHLLSAQFSHVRFFAHISSILTYFSQKSHLSGTKKMYVNLVNDFMDVACFDHGKLLLSNSFVGREMTDRLYYMMYAWVQTGMNQELDEISFMGTTSGNAALFEMIDKYVRHRSLISSEVQKEINDILK